MGLRRKAPENTRVKVRSDVMQPPVASTTTMRDADRERVVQRGKYLPPLPDASKLEALLRSEVARRSASDPGDDDTAAPTDGSPRKAAPSEQGASLCQALVEAERHISAGAALTEV